MSKKSPLVLLILDGWGCNDSNENNAIASAHTPHWTQWRQQFPYITLDACGKQVGLPENQMGNSEVGHMHIGAGRVLPQDYTRINDAIHSHDFANNPVFLETLTALTKQHRALHVMGLLSSGGVHSHEDHLFAFLRLCAREQFFNVYLHLFLDGRDTPPKSAKQSLLKLEKHLQLYPVATIASLTGRYYAMDRDKRWERLAGVYHLLTENVSPHHYPTADKALTAYYEQNITDEFIPPTRIGYGRAIESGDAVFFFNFRSDRARQLTEAFVNQNFNHFLQPQKPRLSAFITMTQYSNQLNTRCVFLPLDTQPTLGQVLAEHGLRQLRVAETEKYAHVTFFLNGGIEAPFDHEDRILIPSLKVATYDLKPEMSAPAITKTIIEAIRDEAYDIIIGNFANADMVGHTGNFSATVQAIEYLDKAMYEIWQTLEQKQGMLLITADHGNAEKMYDKTTKQAHTAHTNAPVPFLFLGQDWHITQPHGSLIDIAPTTLSLLGIKPPKQMQGIILLAKNDNS